MALALPVLIQACTLNHFGNSLLVVRLASCGIGGAVVHSAILLAGLKTLAEPVPPDVLACTLNHFGNSFLVVRLASCGIGGAVVDSASLLAALKTLAEPVPPRCLSLYVESLWQQLARCSTSKLLHWWCSCP